MNIKVLHINSYYKDALYGKLVSALASHEVNSTTYFFTSFGANSTRKNDPGVRYAECYGQIDRLFFLIKERKALKALQAADIKPSDFDVLHAHSLFSNGYVAMKLAAEACVPYVVAVRNTDVNVFFKYRRNLRSLGYSILQNAAAVIFISASYRDEVLNNILPSRMRAAVAEKAVVIPNGIDEIFLNNMPHACKQLGPEKVRILQVGNINANKGQLTTMKACELLSQRGHNVDFSVVGKIGSKNVARELSQRKFVTIMPYMKQADLIQQYRNADIFVMPSKHETFGLSYVEAMSQGLPVIYSKGQGFDGKYSDGEVGYAVECRDAKAVADRIESVFEHYQELSERCLEHAKEYSWDSIAYRYVELYKIVLQASSACFNGLEENE